MDLAGLVVFSTALFIGAASPGPGVAAIVARVLGRGTKGAVAFTTGVAIGDVVWLTFAVVGLATLAHAFHGVFVAIKWAGIAYLLYLAWKLDRTGGRPGARAAQHGRGAPRAAVSRRACDHHG